MKMSFVQVLKTISSFNYALLPCYSLPSLMTPSYGVISCATKKNKSDQVLYWGQGASQKLNLEATRAMASLPVTLSQTLGSPLTYNLKIQVNCNPW